MIGLDQTATIYGRGAGGGFTVVAKSDLPCRLCHVSTATAGSSRVELSGIRNMLWNPDYEMPDVAQVEVDGLRWNVVRGTIATYRGPNSAPVYKRCDLVRAAT